MLSILFWGLVGFLTNGIAYQYGFFKLPTYARPPVRFIDLLAVFGIYLGFLFFIPLFVLKIFNPSNTSSITTVQFLLVASMLGTLLFYIRAEGQGTLSFALKNPHSNSPRWFDFGLGVLVWLIAFPWVNVVSQFCDLLLKSLFNFQSYEQVAVKYLKENLESPLQLIVALSSIIIIAPIVEEILFRGTLQQYLKKYFSLKTSIILTSVIFAFFHFSSTQGLGNLSLIPSLFAFACFLGYIYERQGSIFASIGLHLAFNLASSFQILLFPES